MVKVLNGMRIRRKINQQENRCKYRTKIICYKDLLILMICNRI